MSTKTNFGKWTFDRKNGLLVFYDAAFGFLWIRRLPRDSNLNQKAKKKKEKEIRRPAAPFASPRARAREW
jgi:hypothetical protein